MHISAMQKVRIFLTACAAKDPEARGKRVLDVGSWLPNRPEDMKDDPQKKSGLRMLCERLGFEYVGLDISPGFNVDIVASRPFVWEEVENEFIDYVISSSVFEHNPFFWVTFAEIARVLKPGGEALVIAPAAGRIHRYPLDCWRFYPDSWSALCALTGLDVAEVINEPVEGKGIVAGWEWSDSCVVAAKPIFEDSASKAQFYERLRPLVEPYLRFNVDDVQPSIVNRGPVFKLYMTYLKGLETRAAKLKADGLVAAPPPPTTPAKPADKAIEKNPA